MNIILALIFSALLLTVYPVNSSALTQWNVGIPTVGDSKSLWPTQVHAQWTVQDALLSNYKRGMVVTWKSATTLTVLAGECTVSNSGGSTRLFLANTSNTDITSTNLDSGGSFSAGTTYYVYAGTSSTTAATATYYISTNSSAPSGVTYYLQLGTFTTDGSANVTSTITNLNIPAGLGAWVSLTPGSVYQASTDGILQGGFTSPGSSGSNPSGALLTDSSNPPTTIRAYCSADKSTFVSTSCTTMVKKGDYYKSVTGLNFLYFISIGN